MITTDNINIESVHPLISPEKLKKEFWLDEERARLVRESRKVIRNILARKDKRMLAIVGPCSIHDPAAALDYAEKLAHLREKYKETLYIVMRVYFEKPRTTLGWRGFLMDPRMDGSCDIGQGLSRGRRLLLDILGKGLPCGSEVLDPIIPQYLSDLLSWAAIGARTTESQTHREITSGLSMPVGFKNSTEGALDIAVNAVVSSGNPHSFIGIDQKGITSVIETRGNQNGHLILRGGRLGPNYHEESVEKAEELMKKNQLEPAVLVDCSHANSGKKHEKQERVLRSILQQRSFGRESLVGFMLESNLGPGRQEIQKLGEMDYGVSITDACIGWEKTEALLEQASAMLS